MMKFFKKIRKQLLAKNNLKKYLLYAIGEIILVVAGILIALQINSWKQVSDNKHEELIILQRLHEDFSNNKESVLRIIKLDSIFEKNQKLLKNILAKNINEKTITIADTLLISTIISPISIFESFTLDEIATTGKSELIQNAELKSLIRKYKIHIESLIIEQNVIRNNVVNLIVPNLAKNTPLNKIYESALRYPKLNLNDRPLNSHSEITISNEFLGLQSQQLFYSKLIIAGLKSLNEIHDQILVQIEKEIEII